MSKLLFVDKNGKQRLEDVGQGGGVSPECTVLFDEREHGAMPIVELGKMEAFDEEVDLLDNQGNVVFVPEKDEQGKVVLDQDGNSIPSATPMKMIKRSLRVLEETTTAHAIATQKENQERINKEARRYLVDTDWMIIRQAETGIACPQDVLDRRSAARSSIIE